MAGTAEEARGLLYMVLYAPVGGGFNTPVPGKTSLHKQVFLLGEDGIERSPKFEKDKFGPFSRELADLLDAGILAKEIVHGEGVIKLTEKGVETAKVFWDQATDREREYVLETKEIINDMEYWEMISYIYSSFPEYAAGADAYGEYTERRVDSACSLFQKKKVSLERASEIAGMRRWDFEEILYKRGIPLHAFGPEEMRHNLKVVESINRHEHMASV
ncbi:MAG: UPF0175 family protein [Nitrosopumilus sp.]|nr:UPF0175 family protein [Nitrosopumilus sp.]MDA7958031.1 UPF0175 family protein [Nitrosopumilus sp.]